MHPAKGGTEMSARALMATLRRALGADGNPGTIQVALLAAAWLATRAVLIAHADHSNPRDVDTYYGWALYMAAHHHLPTEGSWQYPSGAALLFLLSNVFGPLYFRSVFTTLILTFDLAATVALVRIGLREKRLVGAWVWVIGVAGVGVVAFLRFDMLPTLLAVLALTLSWSGGRQRVFGVLLGLGAAVKVWPAIGLLAASTRRGGRATAIIWCVVAFAAVVVGTSFFLGNPFLFLGHESARGLEIESVAATPWFIRHLLSGPAPAFALVNQSPDLLSGTSHDVVAGLHILMLLSGAYFAAWWLSRARTGKETSPTLGRDAVFAAMLWFVVISPVLSLQYLVWLVGLAAVAVSSRETVMRRPAALTLVASIITGRSANVVGYHAGSTSWIILDTLRNIVLLLAAIDGLRRIGPPLSVAMPIGKPKAMDPADSMNTSAQGRASRRGPSGRRA